MENTLMNETKFMSQDGLI